MTHAEPVHPGQNKTPGIPLSDRDRKLLIDVLSVQSTHGYEKTWKAHGTSRMQLFIRRLAKSYGCRVTAKDNNLYVTKGKASLYPCYVAHTDTVHDIVPDEDYVVYHDPNWFGALFAYNAPNDEFLGVGGDDKVGIFIALVMLRDLRNVKAAFFYDEEIGCVGARQADMTFFEDCAFAIECDRRGNADLIRNAGTELHGADFAEAILPAMKQYGYGNAHGMLTDVKTLKENGLAVACCNISCGYYQPHSNKEYVLPDDVGRTLALVQAITEATKHQAWPHQYVKPTYAYSSYVRPKGSAQRTGWAGEWGGGTFYDMDDEWDSDYETLWPECPDCGQAVSQYGWCYRCARRLTDDEIDAAILKARALSAEQKDEILSLDDYLGGDGDCPPCIKCGSRSTVFDETVGMCFCPECWMYYDLTGKMILLDWESDGRSDEDDVKQSGQLALPERVETYQD